MGQHKETLDRVEYLKASLENRLGEDILVSSPQMLRADSMQLRFNEDPLANLIADAIAWCLSFPLFFIFGYSHG